MAFRGRLAELFGLIGIDLAEVRYSLDRALHPSFSSMRTRGLVRNIILSDEALDANAQVRSETEWPEIDHGLIAGPGMYRTRQDHEQTPGSHPTGICRA